MPEMAWGFKSPSSHQSRISLSFCQINRVIRSGLAPKLRVWRFIFVHLRLILSIFAQLKLLSQPLRLAILFKTRG